MITTIEQFKIFESSNNRIVVYNPTELYQYISTNGPNGEFDPRFKEERNGGHKVFKYFSYGDYNGMYVNDNNTRFFGIFEGDLMVGLALIFINQENTPKNIWWLRYLCIDPAYEGKGYASQLADYLFKYFKQHGYTFETSSYTDQGYVKLKPLFNRLAVKYNVPFIDKEKF